MKESIALNDQNGTETDDCCHHWKINDDADATAERSTAAACRFPRSPSPIPVVGAIPRLFHFQHSTFKWTIYPVEAAQSSFSSAFLISAN